MTESPPERRPPENVAWTWISMLRGNVLTLLQLLRVEVEHRHQIVPFAGKKCTVVLGVEGHAMVALAAAHGIRAGVAQVPR